jgi:hypothetical protein
MSTGTLWIQPVNSSQKPIPGLAGLFSNRYLDWQLRIPTGSPIDLLTGAAGRPSHIMVIKGRQNAGGLCNDGESIVE